MTSYEWHASSIQRLSSENLHLSPFLRNVPDISPTFKTGTVKSVPYNCCAMGEKKGNEYGLWTQIITYTPVPRGKIETDNRNKIPKLFSI